MSSQYRIFCYEKASSPMLAQELAQKLQSFVQPLLVILDAYLDKRLVRTFLELLSTIVEVRHREQGLVLSELGATLLSADRAPAGVKRISRLLHSPKWVAELIGQFLFRQAEQHLKRLEEQGEVALCVWDGSELEKPESQKVEGLCPVRSSKGKRLNRSRKGCFSPAAGKPILVPGIQWLALVLLGMQGPLSVVGMHWWTSRGPHASSSRKEEEKWLRKLAQAWGRRVIHIFDQGWAGGPWLTRLCGLGLRFIERWRKDYKLLDLQGHERKAWELMRGKRAQAATKLWNAHQRRAVPISWVSLPVRHAEVPGAILHLIVVRSTAWQQPWYLLTNEAIESPEDSLRVILAYARRWQIEWSFRFQKSELGIEHARLRKWEDQRKLLAMVSLVYAFFLSLLEGQMQVVLSWLLRFWDHQTGERARTTQQPLYRLRRALARLWDDYRPRPPSLYLPR
jgi:hypothetical protein